MSLTNELTPLDARHKHGTEVYVVKACYHEDGADLLAVGGASSVEVLLTTGSTCKVIATFEVGTRVTCLAWSSRTISPAVSDEWLLELTGAGATNGLFHLQKAYDGEEEMFHFGGGLSGHHSSVNDMTFCGGRGEDSWRYIATASDDRCLMIWDLEPTLPPTPGEDDGMDSPRPQPTALVWTFPRPLVTVNSHPMASKELLVSDNCGSIFLLDWRLDPLTSPGAWSSHVIELIEPRALSDTLGGLSARWSGSVSWQRDSADLVGAAYGSRFAIWDMGKLQGAKPNLTGPSFAEGCRQFRWCPTNSEYFAISSSVPGKPPSINVHSIYYPNAAPVNYRSGEYPVPMRSFDWLPGTVEPRIAAGVGQQVFIYPIGEFSS